MHCCDYSHYSVVIDFSFIVFGVVLLVNVLAGDLSWAYTTKSSLINETKQEKQKIIKHPIKHKINTKIIQWGFGVLGFWGFGNVKIINFLGKFLIALIFESLKMPKRKF